MSEMMKRFTAEPKLSPAETWRAVFEGRQFARTPKVVRDPWRRGGPSLDAQIEFASRSLAHMSIYVFMGGATWGETHELHRGMREGTDGQLEYPLPYIADKLRSLALVDRREAWLLFGKGFAL